MPDLLSRLKQTVGQYRGRCAYSGDVPFHENNIFCACWTALNRGDPSRGVLTNSAVILQAIEIGDLNIPEIRMDCNSAVRAFHLSRQYISYLSLDFSVLKGFY